jgi:NADH:ubiquinone oxidoreductase subunit 6 (subunit J)
MNDTKKLQRWLGMAAILFVLVYVGAVFLTLQSRLHDQARPTMIESARAMEQERHLMLPELLLPIGILLTLAGCYLFVRRRNQKAYQRLDDDLEETDDSPTRGESEITDLVGKE